MDNLQLRITEPPKSVNRLIYECIEQLSDATTLYGGNIEIIKCEISDNTIIIIITYRDSFKDPANTIKKILDYRLSTINDLVYSIRLQNSLKDEVLTAISNITAKSTIVVRYNGGTKVDGPSVKLEYLRELLPSSPRRVAIARIRNTIYQQQ